MAVEVAVAVWRSLTQRVSARWKRVVNGDQAADAGAGEDGGGSQGIRSAGAVLPGGEWSVWRDKALPDHGEHIVLFAKAWSPGRTEEDGKGKSWKVLKGKSVDRGKGGGEKENDEEGAGFGSRRSELTLVGLEISTSSSSSNRRRIGCLPRPCLLRLRTIGSGACISRSITTPRGVIQLHGLSLVDVSRPDHSA